MNTNQENENNLHIGTDTRFRSHDLGLVTAISLFYPIEAIDRSQNPHKAQFLFKREEGLDEIVEAYFRGELKASLLAYFQQLKVVKARLYEGV